MNNLIIPISNEEFKTAVHIKFNKITTGLDFFKNFSFSNKSFEENIINFIEYVFKINNNFCYIDFYATNLTKSEKSTLINLVSSKDKESLLANLDISNKSIYYKIDNIDLIPLFVRLSTREIFFITFYFTHKPITIWGNYNKEFPCFFETDEDFNFYCDLAKNYELI